MRFRKAKGQKRCRHNKEEYVWISGRRVCSVCEDIDKLQNDYMDNLISLYSIGNIDKNESSDS